MKSEAVSTILPPQIAECLGCGHRLTPYDVMGSSGQNGEQPVRLAWQCGECEATGILTVPAPLFTKMNNRWEDFLGKSKYSYDTELVGRQVQAFRRELDDVATVDDIDWGADV